jgi:hypothetical protein
MTKEVVEPSRFFVPSTGEAVFDIRLVFGIEGVDSPLDETWEGLCLTADLNRGPVTETAAGGFVGLRLLRFLGNAHFTDQFHPDRPLKTSLVELPVEEGMRR